MRDRFFYPLALLIIAAIVALAVLPGVKRAGLNNEQILREGYVLTGENLSKLTSASTIFVDYVRDQDGVIDLARAYGNMSRDMAPPSVGVFGTMSASYNKIFAGHSLEVKVRVRRSPGSTIEQFDLGFFTLGKWSSRWHKFTPTDSYQDFSFIYEAPPELADQPVSRIGVWPGDKGDSQPLDIQSMTVKIVQP